MDIKIHTNISEENIEEIIDKSIRIYYYKDGILKEKSGENE